MTQTGGSLSGPAPGSGRINMTSLLAGFALGAVLASFAWVQIVPTESGEAAFDPNDFFFVGGQGPVEGQAVDQEGEGPQTRVIQRGTDGGQAQGAEGGVDVGGGLEGANTGGGSGPGGGEGSSTGVSGSKIKLGATYVAGGIAEDFLGEVRDGMEAVRSRVNRAGGVHGRQLDVVYKNDNWDPTRGRSFIENLIQQEKVFALAVSPSSEGLNAASQANLFRNDGVPVVGADGLNNTQFTDPWIWPVATATTTNVHIIMKQAWDQGKRNPAIVFGNTYRFGVEGAFAFNQAYNRLSGGDDIPGFSKGEKGCQRGSRYCGISGDANQYTAETERVEDACSTEPACDFILLLLEPKSAQNWMTDFRNPARTSDKAGANLAGAQPLFTTSFGDNCKDACDGMTVWTGYNPPIGEFADKPQVNRYQQELLAQKSSADVNNQFTMGGYIGMELLVEALDKAGKDLTREKLVAALNGGIGLETGLTATPELSWTESERYANEAAHGYEMRWDANAKRFAGFFRATGYVNDPWLGQDNQT